jgi:ABC-type phosphate/phosphonate transport system substrate-binding protein
MKASLVPVLLLLAGAGLSTSAGAADLGDPNLVKIGMVSSLFNDVPQPIVNILMPPFKGLIKQFTGLDGDVLVGGDVYDMARQVAQDKIHLAVFHGVEFGWAQQKYPELRPLMIAINKHRTLQAHVIVAREGAVAEFADLKGKSLAIPLRTKEHCRMFVEKCCTGCGSGTQSYFSEVARPLNVESALDDVLSGRYGAAVVDTVSWENYEDVKPGCHKRLKALKTSEIFPSAVIAYREGGLGEQTLTRFRTGMQSANKNERGRDLMTLWKISAFEPVPQEYTQTVADIIHAYPAPLAATPVSRGK